jgi:hypothetical protein
VTTEPERSAVRLPGRARRRRVIALAVVAAAAGAAIGVGASAGDHSASVVATFSDPMASAPLVQLPGGLPSFVSIPMGHLSDPRNTFWQLIRNDRPGPHLLGAFTLATPKGVADNGGLLLAAGPGQLLVGFGPSNLLTFSPVALSRDAGRHFSSGLIDQPLEKVPDALATLGGGRFGALTAPAGGTVLVSTGSTSSWAAVTTARALANTSAGRSCGLTALTAIAAGPDGSLLLGGRCTKGATVGLFALSVAHHVTAIAATAPGAGPSEVLRFGSGDALVERLTGGSSSFVAVPLGRGATSGSLRAAAGDRLVATSAIAGAEAGFLVLLESPTGRLSLSELPHGGVAISLPTPPAGTVFVGGSPAGGLTAYAVHSSTLVVWATTPGADHWRFDERLVVPILYGSSG